MANTRYIVTDRTLDITETMTISPEEGYGGWFAINQGANVAYVNGYELQPGEGLDMRDAVPAGCKWGKNIKVIVNPGGVVRITRLQYKAV